MNPDFPKLPLPVSDADSKRYLAVHNDAHYAAQNNIPKDDLHAPEGDFWAQQAIEAAYQEVPDEMRPLAAEAPVPAALTRPSQGDHRTPRRAHQSGLRERMLSSRFARTAVAIGAIGLAVATGHFALDSSSRAANTPGVHAVSHTPHHSKAIKKRPLTPVELAEDNLKRNTITFAKQFMHYYIEVPDMVTSDATDGATGNDPDESLSLNTFGPGGFVDYDSGKRELSFFITDGPDGEGDPAPITPSYLAEFDYTVSQAEANKLNPATGAGTLTAKDIDNVLDLPDDLTLIDVSVSDESKPYKDDGWVFSPETVFTSSPNGNTNELPVTIPTDKEAAAILGYEARLATASKSITSVLPLLIGA